MWGGNPKQVWALAAKATSGEEPQRGQGPTPEVSQGRGELPLRFAGRSGAGALRPRPRPPPRNPPPDKQNPKKPTPKHQNFSPRPPPPSGPALTRRLRLRRSIAAAPGPAALHRRIARLGPARFGSVPRLPAGRAAGRAPCPPRGPAARPGLARPPSAGGTSTPPTPPTTTRAPAFVPPIDRRGGGPPPAPEQPGSCSAGRGPAGGARLTDTAGRAGGEGREGGGGVAGSRLRESGPREEAEGRPGSEA